MKTNSSLAKKPQKRDSKSPPKDSKPLSKESKSQTKESRFNSLWQLAPYVQIGFQQNILYIGFGSIQKKIEDKRSQSNFLKTIELFLEPISFENALIALKEEGLEDKEALKIISTLAQECLIPAGVFKSQHRHSRSLLFYALSGADVSKVQTRISKSKVGIVGCGSVGNVVAVSLATAGVQQFVLFDGDTVELSNLNRQIMFKESDQGKPKVEVLGEALLERSSDLEIVVIKDYVEEHSLRHLKGCDFVVLSGDQGGIVKMINRFCVNEGIPFMNIGYIEDVAVWGPLVIPGKTGCLACQNRVASEEGLSEKELEILRKVNARYQAPSNSPVNMLACSFATLDILKFLGGFGEVASINSRVGIWTHNLKFERLDYTRNPDCKVCAGKLPKAP
jgi:molybdopterin/thiamine biosynthesis adenylyltransferase